MPRRPRDFEGTFGQKRLASHLTKLVAGARILGQACPSMLFFGPNGVGKTTFAKALANRVGTAFEAIIARSDTLPAHLCNKLLGLADTDVLFIDEGHSLSSACQDVLFDALDSHKVPAVDGKGKLDSERQESIAEFTLIVATNRPIELEKGLRTRLIEYEFDPYSHPELREIGRRAAIEQQLELTNQALTELAKMANTPRGINNFIDEMRVFFAPKCDLGEPQIRQFLVSKGIDENGLGPVHRQYLQILGATTASQASVHLLATKIGLGQRYLEEEIEPLLLEKHLIEIQHGRRLTAQGKILVRGMSDSDEGDGLSLVV